MIFFKIQVPKESENLFFHSYNPFMRWFEPVFLIFLTQIHSFTKRLIFTEYQLVM